MKEDRNNLGRQYTSDPNFGTTFPNTQYKGYAEGENSPFGGPSARHTPDVTNQYGYSSRYQGNNPHHREDRLENPAYHAPEQNQYQSSVGRAQYKGSGLNQYPGDVGQIQNPERSQYHGGFAQYQGNEHGRFQETSGQFRPYYQNNSQYQGGSQYQNSSQYQGGNNFQPMTFQPMVTGPMTGTAVSGQTTTLTQPTPVSANQPRTAENLAQQLQKGPQYNDRDRVRDLMLSEKHLTEEYNISAYESGNPQLRDTLKRLLNDTHTNNEILQRVMEDHGWTRPDQADQQQISQTFHRYTSYKSQLPF